MNVLFLSLEVFKSINDHNLYTDLLREFVNNGHVVCSVTPLERRMNRATELVEEGNSRILRLKIGNMQKTNIFEKGFSTITIESLYIKGIKKYFSDVKFDLVLYATPPITFCNVIKYVKQRDKAMSYLMLKDIFPQNAVDLGMISKSGMTSFIYRFFRAKENRLYAISDYIGCMSPANIQYLMKQNPEIEKSKVGLSPNSIEVIDKSVEQDYKVALRKKYDIPVDQLVVIYGGNLGKPQGIAHLIDCFEAAKDSGVYFVVVGSGTEREKLERYIVEKKPRHVQLIAELSRDEYDSMVGSCDIGLICLDHRFTIPNFPSRLLAYMQAKMPILSVTDPNTDIGKIITDNGFGWSCTGNTTEEFCSQLQEIKKVGLTEMGEKAWRYLNEHYSVKQQYETIMNVVKKINQDA